ncbi:ImcF-related family protein [Pseudomonas knackmussii]|uniref:ImcF-related family protein n=1 Tax=Pseudomonas knackmussii TaxID=65741 RepID=UPI001362C430|nr:ImcF-related family protein [Pseudomonas knackmussii]
MTQVPEPRNPSLLGTFLLMALLVAVLVLAGSVAWWLWEGSPSLDRAALKTLLFRGLLCWAVLFALAALVWFCVQKGIRQLIRGRRPVKVPSSAEVLALAPKQKLAERLRSDYGLFWPLKVRLLLVVGEPAELDAVAPGLSPNKWLEGQGTVLLWGGSLGGEMEASTLVLVKGLRRWRPLDGIVWALNEAQRDDVEALGTGVRRLRDLGGALGWQAPLYLWQVCASEWSQAERKAQPVGCLFPKRASPEQVEASLRELVEPLRQRGWRQMQEEGTAYDFLLRLGHELEGGSIAKWREALAPFLGKYLSLPLRGLLFGLPQKAPDGLLKHAWWPNVAWQGVLEDREEHGRRLGWSAPRMAYCLVLGVAALWGLGLLLSFANNRSQIADAQTALSVLRQPGDLDSQITALHELTRELGRLDYQAQQGVPWFLRFGLSHNAELLNALWPSYAEANNRLLRDVADKDLKQRLTAFAALPPGSPERAARAVEGHDQLKAYLMLARPEKADAAFLTKALHALEKDRPDIKPGLWQGLSPNLWAFYAEHLPNHPDWRIQADAKVVAQARQVLLGQLGQRNGVASLYEKLLEGAGNNYPDLHLLQMVGETDAQALFDTPNSVPGAFTRQAWEGYVRAAIDEIAEARREEIDWVLSDRQNKVADDLQPDALKAQLTERYFQEFADSWLAFLNSLRWRRADNLPEVIDQLSLMSDVRQSPLIALMNTLAYQGRTGAQGQALADSLMKSAQQLLDKDKQPAIDQRALGLHGPLDATFGPLLALLGKEEGATGSDETLSLTAFLTRVTRVRLKLQQVTNAADPQAMTQALAQTVFQGKSIDLTDTRDYGSLLAASLGEEWSGFGQSLFVQPLAQAWEGVLQPSAQSLNRQWQRSIISNWNRAFDGRYPFAGSGSDASLPMLGQMIRGGGGRIEQFLAGQLGGVLRKEGNHWVADAGNSQGLRFDPAFLKAINQLSALADLLYTDGGMGLTFQLQAKPVRDVVQTTLIVDGERLEYFNQMEFWQSFSWPSRIDHPGASLSWTSVRTGTRLYGDYAGTWGLIRLLEQAQVTPLDDSDTRFQVVLKAADGLPLTWHLRTELGQGPLALLQLRGFKLPERIFATQANSADPYAINEEYE